MTERRIGHDDRVEAFLFQLVTNRQQVRDERFLALGGVRDVAAIHQYHLFRLGGHRPLPRRVDLRESCRAESALTIAPAIILACAMCVCSIRTARPASNALRSGSVALPASAAKPTSARSCSFKIRAVKAASRSESGRPACALTIES